MHCGGKPCSSTKENKQTKNLWVKAKSILPHVVLQDQSDLVFCCECHGYLCPSVKAQTQSHPIMSVFEFKVKMTYDEQ